MKDLHPVEILILATMATAWAAVTLARLIVLPLIAVVLAAAARPPAPMVGQPAAPAATGTAEPPLASDLAAMRDALMAESATTLRQITGTRRRCSKAEMVAMVLAMPI